MKNLLFSALMLFSTAAVTSCSTDPDPDPSQPSGGMVPKKIERSYSQNYPVSTITYTYDGNKLKEINLNPQYDVSKVKFTYTGDNITKMELFSGVNFTPYTNYDIEYQNDKMVKYSATYNGTTTVRNYTHHSDGTITTDNVSNSYMKFTTSNGNITKIESFSNGVVTSTNNFTFDDKNNIHKNITGLNKIIELERLVWDLTQVNTNNKLSDDSGNNTYTYEYNSDNFPTKSIKTQGTSTTTSVITY